MHILSPVPQESSERASAIKARFVELCDKEPSIGVYASKISQSEFVTQAEFDDEAVLAAILEQRLDDRMDTLQEFASAAMSAEVAEVSEFADVSVVEIMRSLEPQLQLLNDLKSRAHEVYANHR